MTPRLTRERRSGGRTVLVSEGAPGLYRPVAPLMGRPAPGRVVARKAIELLLLSFLALCCVGMKAWGWESVVRVLGGLVAFAGGIAVLAAITARWEPEEPEGRVVPGREPRS
jgi:hypothetical protein